MQNRIKVSEPINLRLEDTEHFKPFLIYKIPPLKVKIVKGAFVTNSGLVCNQKGLMKECYHFSFENEFEDRLREASYYCQAVQNDAENLITLDDDKTYLVIHHTWHNNYYHWLCETLLRLWMVKDKISELVLLLPSKDQLSPFVKATLAPFRFKDVFHIPMGKSLLVRSLCMPQLKPVMACYNPEALKDINKIYVNYVKEAAKIDINLGERIYISREKSRRRKIINEADVISVLEEYGFAIVYNEDYLFYEQVSFYSKAKYLIGCHGAGLTNMLFMPSSSKILEFHKRQTNFKDHHSLIFWYLADGLGHQYYQQVCDPTNYNDDFFMADYIVNIPSLRENVKAMLELK